MFLQIATDFNRRVNMAAKTTSVTNKALQSEVNSLKTQNNNLTTSVSNLKDEVVTLKKEVETFRKMVTEDIRKIVDKLV
jgi:predicted RNase H-like nuclease (RuvC/YqgF family)